MPGKPSTILLRKSISAHSGTSLSHMAMRKHCCAQSELLRRRRRRRKRMEVPLLKTTMMKLHKLILL
jgi:hypothetical protein